MMDVHDRGTMKWVSLMLPEHVEMLEDVFAERQVKPLLDEQEQMEIDQKLKYSLTHQTNIEMTYYKQGKYQTLYGKIERIDQWKGYIVLSSGQGDFIPLTDITEIII